MKAALAKGSWIGEGGYLIPLKTQKNHIREESDRKQIPSNDPLENTNRLRCFAKSIFFVLSILVVIRKPWFTIKSFEIVENIANGGENLIRCASMGQF